MVVGEQEARSDHEPGGVAARLSAGADEDDAPHWPRRTQPALEIVQVEQIVVAKDAFEVQMRRGKPGRRGETGAPGEALGGSKILGLAILDGLAEPVESRLEPRDGLFNERLDVHSAWMSFH